MQPSQYDPHQQNYAPQPQQQYGPPQQGWGPPSTPPQAPPAPQQQSFDGFVSPANLSETGGGPKPRNLIGCVVVYMPKSVHVGTAYKSTAAKESVLADLIVVSSPNGSIEYGDSGDRENPRPNTHRIVTPCFFPSVMIGNGQVMNALRSHIGGKPVLGTLVWGQQAILFNKVEDPAVNAEAGRICMAHFAGQMQWPAPEPLAGPGSASGYTDPNAVAQQLGQQQYPANPQAQPQGAPSWGQAQQQAPQAWGQAQQQAPQGWPAPGAPGNAGM